MLLLEDLVDESPATAIAWRQRRLEELKLMPPGTEVPCHYGPIKPRHSDECLCNGTGVLVREVVIDDLLFDLEVLHK